MTTWTVPATITRVIDGDTVVANLDLGWNVWLIDRHIRLSGVNAPEMSTSAGVTARQFVVNLLNQRMPVGDSGPLRVPVTVVSHSLDKYGRILGEVRYPPKDTPPGLLLPLSEHESLADVLLAAGHAVEMR